MLSYVTKTYLWGRVGLRTFPGSAAAVIYSSRGGGWGAGGEGLS